MSRSRCRRADEWNARLDRRQKIGTVTFSAGTKTLGSAVLSNGSATLPAAGSGLATGSNIIVATYGGSGTFASSTSAPVTLTVQPTAIGTSTVVAASPAAIAPSATTVLTATVKALGTPTGSVTFTVGNTLLGAAVLNRGTAVLAVKGSILAAGNNSITASYAANGNFAGSSSTVTVNVTGGITGTTIVFSAAPGTKASTTVLTAIVKAACGSKIPTGSVTFALGTKLLGSSVLTASGAGGTGTLTLNNSVLMPGNNSIAANYAGAAGFSSSTASVIVVGH